MHQAAHRVIAQRLKAIWERTGVIPAMSLSQSPGLLSWFRRHIAPVSPQNMVPTIGERLRVALGGGASEAVVLVPVSLEARHGSGVEFQSSLSYATGLLPMQRAREMAEALKEQGAVVVPSYPDTIQRHLAAHLDRRVRHDGSPEPEVFTPTATLAQRMRHFGTLPSTMTVAQIRGEEPLPGTARLAPRPTLRPRARRELDASPAYRPSFAT